MLFPGIGQPQCVLRGSYIRATLRRWHISVSHTFFQYHTTHESEWKPGNQGSRHQPKITWATIRDCFKACVWNAGRFIFIISLAKRSWGTGGFCCRSDVWSVRGRPEQRAMCWANILKLCRVNILPLMRAKKACRRNLMCKHHIWL